MFVIFNWQGGELKNGRYNTFKSGGVARNL